MYYDPRLAQMLSKFSATVDKNELRNAEADAREKSALEWKQVRTKRERERDLDLRREEEDSVSSN